MSVELVTIEGVPILRVGSYNLASGPRTFTEEDLRDAAEALANDQGVKRPRIKIDSLEKAMDLDPEAHGGEPAFGYVDNLRVTSDGQDLLADFHVPEAVRDGMTWAFPSLSIEGLPPGWTSSTGRSYGLVITAIALLGVHWPGCTTLDDLSEFLANGPKFDAAAQAEEVVAHMPQRARPVAASLDADLIGRRFYDLLEEGDIDMPEAVESSQWNLWIRSMRFDDDGQPYLKVTDEGSGTLYRVDLTVSGSDVTFGDFVEVVEQDVPVAAGMARPAAPLASWATREASRAVRAQQNENEEEASMTDEQRRALATAHGLDPETATEAEVLDAAVAATEGGDPPTPEGGGAPPAPEPEPEPEPAPVAARGGVPEGAVLIDADELARLRAGAQTATELAQAASDRDRDGVIAGAIDEGRFAPSRREHWVRAWAADPEGTRHLLTAPEAEGGLAPNTIPVSARGREEAEEVAANADREHEAYMQRFHGNTRARQRGGRVRHRTEV